MMRVFQTFSLTYWYLELRWNCSEKSAVTVQNYSVNFGMVLASEKAVYYILAVAVAVAVVVVIVIERTERCFQTSMASPRERHCCY